MKILIADDDRVHAHLVSSRLKLKGFEVIVAFDAVQAWMAAMREAPDAIVLDISMPGGSGFEVLRRLKASTKTSQIPVVVLSGSIDAKGEQSVRDLGADEFLRKPADFDRLYDDLCRLLHRPPESTS